MTAMILLSEWERSQVEFWKPIQGWAGYDISSKARVRSWWCRGGKGATRILGTIPTMLKAFRRPRRVRGSQLYTHHFLYGKNKRRIALTHRLVAEAFIANPLGLKEVNHKTGYGLQNWVDNLEWVTQPQNRRHALDNGLVVMPTAMKWVSLKRKTMTPDDVREIRLRAANGERQSVIAQDFKVQVNTVNRIVNRVRWAFVE